VVEAWEGLLKEAQAGDTIYFTYAGHGSQEPAAPNDPDEPDGLDNNLPLVNFALKGPGLADRIVDKEMAVWLKEAEAKKVYAVVVTDACHSGTMYRSVTLGLTYRVAPKPQIDRNELLQFAPPPPVVSVKVSPNDQFTFLAGVADDKLVPEVAIDGQQRGALSYAFARAIEGQADANHDGVTTEKELVSFVRAFVLQATQSQQISQSFPTVSRDIPVLRSTAADAGAGAGQDVKSAIAIAEQAVANSPLKLAVRDGQLPQAIPGAEIVDDEAQADLVYDAGKGTVEKRVAGVVAEGVQPSALPGIVAKWRAIAFLQALAGGSIQPFEVAGGSRTFKRGETLTVGLGASNHRFMTLFNLPPNGEVEFLYPTSQAEHDEDWSNKPFALPLQVRDPPFGAEHLIAILSDQPLDQLHTALKGLSSPEAATDLPDTLKNALNGQAVTVGIANIFTSAGAQ
jgi:Caspase domain